MARATWVLATTSLVAAALATWLYVDNRALRAQLAERTPAPAATSPAPHPTVAARSAEPAAASARTVTPITHAGAKATPEPALPEQPTETRLDRRARRTEEFAAMFGRADGETEAEYKARILPMISAGLMVPRLRAEEQRRTAQEKAHVTPEQAARLDKAFDKVYSDVVDFTNKAITDGQLSPYERNVSSWLEFAGGLGGILGEANGQIGKILEPSQIRAMYDSGFEWGEYLGLKVPWEQLRAPPSRPK